MRIAFILWLVVLVCLSLSPFEVKQHLHSMGRFHIVYHLVAFVITTILLVLNARTLAGRALAIAIAVCLAFGTELLEYMHFTNPFEWQDVLTDCLGILLGLMLLWIVGTLRLGRRSQLTRD